MTDSKIKTIIHSNETDSKLPKINYNPTIMN